MLFTKTGHLFEIEKQNSLKLLYLNNKLFVQDLNVKDIKVYGFNTNFSKKLLI